MSGGFGFGGGGSAGFSFGAKTTQSGFSFGAQSTPVTSGATAGGLNFAPNTQATTTATQGFSFSGFGAGGAQASAKPNVAFGTPTAQATATPGLSGFGTPATPASTAVAAAPASQATQVSGVPLLGFGTPSTQPSTAGGGFNFGGATASTPAATTQAATIPAGFGFGATTAQATTRQAPTAAAGFGFGTTAAATAATSQPSTAAAGFGFGVGAAQPPSTSGGLGSLLAAKTTVTSVTTQSTSGFTLGGVKPVPTTAPSSAGFSLAGATTQAGGGGSLGFNLATAKTTAATAPTTAAPSLGAGLKPGGFGSTAVTTSSGGLSLMGKPLAQAGTSSTATTAVTLSTATTTTSSAGTAPAMNYRQLEEEINKWSVELEEQEKIFIEQATQVNAWDRLLIENGDKISQLNMEVERVKLDQQRLDGDLDFINAQQRELEEMLVPLEQAVEQMPAITFQQHADLEREHTYKQSENIDAQLKRMVQDLKEIIDHMNASNTNTDANDPLQQIAKILNAHMHSLQWIDSNTALLQRRVDDVTKLADHRKKEQERNFRLAYD